jgi:trehalose 2-sulfotransferase
MPISNVAARLLRSHLRKPAQPLAAARPDLHIPAWTSPGGVYIVCTNPRSGSWLLSDGLARTGVAGNPREWFNFMEEQQHRARFRKDYARDLSFPTYLRIARARSTTPNGVSGVKLHTYQLTELRRRVAALARIEGLTDVRLMARFFPGARLLWLRRRDKAQQAISLSIATQTEQWWAIDGVEPEPREAPSKDPAFDATEVARIEAALARGDLRWRSLFQDLRIEPLVVDYEDLAADYSVVLQRVLGWLGVSPTEPVGASPRLRRQSDARSEGWLERYLKFKAAQGLGSDFGEPAPPGGPLFESAQKPLERVPNAWKEWVAEAKRRNTPERDIAAVLVRNGYSRAASLTAASATSASAAATASPGNFSSDSSPERARP